MTRETRLRVASKITHDWQVNKKRTCAWLKILGLHPKKKSHPLCGWIFTLSESAVKNVGLCRNFLSVFCSNFLSDSAAENCHFLPSVFVVFCAPILPQNAVGFCLKTPSGLCGFRVLLPLARRFSDFIFPKYRTREPPLPPRNL